MKQIMQLIQGKKNLTNEDDASAASEVTEEPPPWGMGDPLFTLRLSTIS